jgi:beta-glucosidase
MAEIIDEIMENITTEEKAGLVCGSSFFGIAGVPSMNIKGLQLLDGGTGINYEQLFGDIVSRLQGEGTGEALKSGLALIHVIEYYYHPEQLTEEEKELRSIIKKDINERLKKNTVGHSLTEGIDGMPGQEAEDLMSPGCFPTGMMLGATWNPEAVYQVGRALGREARAYGVHMLLGTPNINIHRDPLNGRLFEGFSEDPALVSGLAPYMVKGVQDEQVAANVKHFAANNQETNRQGINETISERALHEIYFPGFAACVKEANPATVMSAYNKINGLPCSENPWLLNGILRNYWGFEGMVVSDWGAVRDQIASLKAGNDVTMPGPVAIDTVMKAIDTGSLTMEELNQSVRRVLKLIMDYGAPGAYEESCRYIMDMSKKAAYDAACEGIVMLKNSRNIFPLQGSAREDSAFSSGNINALQSPKVYLCGSGAAAFYDCGQGSAGINTDRTTRLYECLAENGIDVSVGIPENSSLREAGYRDEIYICVVRVQGMEGNDRENMDISGEDAVVLNRLVRIKKGNSRVKLGVILNTCGPVNLMPWIEDIDGLFSVFLPGMEGGHAMADILTGRVNPSGKLPLTFPKSYKDTPTYLSFPGDGYEVNYGEGIFVGYRYYDKKGVEPLFPFGYGMSYSKFAIHDAWCDIPAVSFQVSDKKGNESSVTLPIFEDRIKVYVKLDNLGSDSAEYGQEVVQLYISDIEATLKKPLKECKAFKKLRLRNGESTVVEFELSKEDFASYDSQLHSWVAEEGIYNILIGNSSRNITASLQVYLNTVSPYTYSLDSTIKVLYENEIIKQKLFTLWEELGLDWGDIMSRYQYVPNTILRDELKESLKERMDNPVVCAMLDEFGGEIKNIVRA